MHLVPLLELLYTARNNFTSIHVSWRYWYRKDLMQTALSNYAAQRSPSVQMLSSKKTQPTPTSSQPERETVINRRLLWQKPTFWRYEEDRPTENNALLRIISDNRFWTYATASNKVYTNVEPEAGRKPFRIRKRKKRSQEQFPSLEDEIKDVPLVDPSFLLATHHLTPIETTTYLDREAIRVRGVYRTGRILPWEPFFWAIADENELLVDSRRGILLYYSAVANHQVIAIASVENVIFDEAISPDLFNFTPPAKSLVEIAV
ncbi:MAG: hypothetical protein IBX69_15035 [Anaerolineales bacterium]|nr:hypothetical protein [Anaerolineales bacterium]